MCPRKLSQWLYNFINLQWDKDGLLWSPYFSSTHTTLSSFCSWREAFIVFFGPFYLWKFFSILIYSVQFTYLVMYDSLRSDKSQNARLSITDSQSLLKLMSIQPSHPLLSPSPPVSNPSQHQGLFQWVNSLREVAKVLEFQAQHQSFQWTPRTDLFQNGLVGSPCSPRDSQESSPTPQFKSVNFSVLSFLHSPTLTSIHDHWKNHSLD